MERLNPSVVVTDIELPDRSGIELLTELHARGSRARVIVFSAHATEEHVRAALTAGASGYILKDASPDELVHGLRSVSAGRRFLCESIQGQILSYYAAKTGRTRDPSYGLSAAAA